MAYRIWAVALVLPLMAGCFPMRIVKTPGVAGRVVGSSNSAPIQGATVSVMFDGMRSGRAPVRLSTDGAGRFVLPAVHGWIIYIVPMDFMGYRGEVRVDASGYQPSSKSLRSSPEGPATVDCGDIVLERVP